MRSAMPQSRRHQLIVLSMMRTLSGFRSLHTQASMIMRVKGNLPLPSACMPATLPAVLTLRPHTMCTRAVSAKFIRFVTMCDIKPAPGLATKRATRTKASD